MTNMAAMPIYGKILKKSSTPELINWWLWKFVCSFKYISTTKDDQIMIQGWPWPIFRQGEILSLRPLYGKNDSYQYFGNYCSLKSQNWSKDSTECVNEAEWVLKVKVILWPWLMVTQISKLKLVFLRNCWVIWNQSLYHILGRWVKLSP